MTKDSKMNYRVTLRTESSSIQEEPHWADHHVAHGPLRHLFHQLNQACFFLVS